MRQLFRAIVALGTLGLAVLGCTRSGSPESTAEHSEMNLEDAPFQAAFRVPCMS